MSQAKARRMKSGPGPTGPPFQAGQSQLMTALRRLRREARCANELERGHLLWRLGQELGVHAEDLHRWGFEKAYRRIVEEEEAPALK